MTLQQLEYIVALDEERHFVRAAERCFVTQPTLSMQVQKLEDELGLQIFDRKRQPIVPTPLGAELIVRARALLREARQLKAMASNAQHEILGQFRLGIIPTLAPYLLPRFLKPFLDRFPQVRLHIEELQTAQILDALQQDGLDVGVLVGPLETPSITEHAVFSEPFLRYASAAHSHDKAVLVPQDLDASDMWILNEGHCFRNQVLNVCEAPAAGEEKRYFYESGSIETLKRMVREGGGYTLVPELALTPEEWEDPGLAIQRFDAPEPVREVVLATHHTYIRRAFVTALQDCIRACLPDSLRTDTDKARVRIY